MSQVFTALLDTPPPRLIPSGQFAWYDPSVASSLHATGNQVDQLDDISGNGRHLTQTGAARPLTGRTINAKTALDFQGAQYIKGAAITRTLPVTVFVVAQSDITTTGNRQIIGDGMTSPTIFTNYSTTERWAMYAGTIKMSATTVNTSAHQLCGIFNGASSYLYLDGTAIVSAQNPGSNGWSADPIGLGANLFGGSYWDGLIAEAIFYPGALVTADRQLVEGYLRSKWNLP